MAPSVHSTNSKEEKHHDEHVRPVDINEERALALRAARAADPGPRFWTIAFMRYLMIALVACSVSGDVGMSRD